MGSPHTAAKGSGKFLPAPDASAPLIVVFGGIFVKGRGQSGVYMWDYMKPIEPRFHIFVANDSSVNGPNAYSSLMSELQPLDPTPQILYLFSGGYWPGMQLLDLPDMPGKFSSIYLVDIWIGDNQKVIKFYKGLADKYAANITYVYTLGAAHNDEARKYIAKVVGPPRAILFEGSHMETNRVAVDRIGALP